MKLAIMQPYFFPYLGYYQLIHSVDTFVVYDDVTYIKGGWINRNNVLAQGKRSLFTLQLKGAGSHRLINQISVGANRVKLVKSIRQNYSKAPQFSTVMPMIEEAMMNPEGNLAKYLEFILQSTCHHLDLKPRWILSSELEAGMELRGQDRVLAICEKLGATEYVNASGGKNLYEAKTFTQHNISLSFITPELRPYKQFNHGFEPGLSIIDVMMFNDKKRCQQLLLDYKVTPANTM